MSVDDRDAAYAGHVARLIATWIVRNVSAPSVPIGARCRLCKLYVDQDNEYVVIEVQYGGPGPAEVNPLVALHRRSWICGPCLDALGVPRPAP